MKVTGFLKGFVAGALVTGAVCLFLPPTGDLLSLHIVRPKEGTVAGRLFHWMSYGLSISPYDAFTQNCTKNVTQNGFEWVFIARDYFGCNRLEIFISDYLYGEITDRSREDLRPLVEDHTYE
jgi:hypothetical protein